VSTAYTLELATDLAPSDLIAIVAAQPDFRRPEAGAPAYERVGLGPGLRVVAGLADEDEADLTRSAVGFHPTCAVSFIEMRRRDVPEGVRYPAMIGAVVALLGEVEGDAAMDFACDILLFRRREGHVTVNLEWDEAQWPDDSPGRGLLRRSMPSATLAALAPL